MLELKAKDSNPTESAYATHALIDDGSTIAGYIPVIVFPGVTPDSHAEWLVTAPPGYGGGAIDYEVQFATDGTSGNDVQYEVRAKKLVAGDTLTSHNIQAQTATDITDTPSTTADVLDVSPTGQISAANMGSPVAGDILRVRLSRDFDHAANTDNAQVVVVVLTEA